MKISNLIITLLLILLIHSCNRSDGQIEIGQYSFGFPPEYEKIKKRGIDSDVATIENETIQIVTDYGYYSNSFNGYEKENEFLFLEEKGRHQIIQDTIFDHHLRRILIAEEPEKGQTGIYLKDLNSYNKSLNSWKALSMSVSGISKSDQEILIEIFRNGKPINSM